MIREGLRKVAAYSLTAAALATPAASLPTGEIPAQMTSPISASVLQDGVPERSTAEACRPYDFAQATSCTPIDLHPTIIIVNFGTTPDNAKKIAGGLGDYLTEGGTGPVHPKIKVYRATDRAMRVYQNHVNGRCVDPNKREDYTGEIVTQIMPSILERDAKVIGLSNKEPCTTVLGVAYPGASNQLGNTFADVYVDEFGGDPSKVLAERTRVTAHEAWHTQGLGHAGGLVDKQDNSPGRIIDTDYFSLFGLIQESTYKEYGDYNIMGSDFGNKDRQLSLNRIQEDVLTWPQAERRITVIDERRRIISPSSVERDQYAVMCLKSPFVLKVDGKLDEEKSFDRIVVLPVVDSGAIRSVDLFLTDSTTQAGMTVRVGRVILNSDGTRIGTKGSDLDLFVKRAGDGMEVRGIPFSQAN